MVLSQPQEWTKRERERESSRQQLLLFFQRKSACPPIALRVLLRELRPAESREQRVDLGLPHEIATGGSEKGSGARPTSREPLGSRRRAVGDALLTHTPSGQGNSRARTARGSDTFA